MTRPIMFSILFGISYYPCGLDVIVETTGIVLYNDIPIYKQRGRSQLAKIEEINTQV